MRNLHECIGLATLTSLALAAAASSNHPNIVFILTDDQDARMNSLDYMPKVQKYLTNEGTQFQKHYAHVALCCPSRVTLWTGQHAHNTNVTDVGGIGGGWPQVQAMGLWNKYLPVWLQEAGYSTYYTGKLYNAHTLTNYCRDNRCAAGWDVSDFLLDPTTYSYYGSSYQHSEGNDHLAPRKVPGYSTDIISNYALGYLDRALNQTGKPFFVGIAPIAPHTSVNGKAADGSNSNGGPIPAAKYENVFTNLTVPRTENFNPDKKSGVNKIWDLPKLTDDNVHYLDGFYQRRIQALQSVDDLVERVVQRLDKAGVLDNTYIIYTADNGYHIGQHRLQAGKKCHFEEDINVPMIMRGPKIQKGGSTDMVTAHVDLAPTIFNMAGIKPRDEFDGSGLPLPLQNPDDFNRAKNIRGEQVNIEFWGLWSQEGNYSQKIAQEIDAAKAINTYKAVRVEGGNYSLLYSVWCVNASHELYDMTTNSAQMNNLHPDAPVQPGAQGNAYHMGNTTLLGRPTIDIINRLDALVLVLKTCKGIQCTSPWKQLHPDGSVSNLQDAVDPKYDQQYKGYPKVAFEHCYEDARYDPQSEGPLWNGTQHPQLLVRDGLSWDTWV